MVNTHSGDGFSTIEADMGHTLAVMLRHLLPSLLSLPIVLSWIVGPAFGQAAPLQQRLAKTRTLNCTFSVKATGTWPDAGPTAEVGAAKIKVAFTNVNVDEGTADAEDAFGKSYIVVRYTSDYLHLIQMHSAGPLYTTTVLAKPAKDGRLLAIHTRHEYTDVRLPGFTSRPEMYLGDCALTEGP
jgi:hypothetical protein